MRSLILTTVSVSLLAGFSATAEEIIEVDLNPIRHAAAELVVVSPSGEEIAYSPADLEEFTTYSMTTTTPWREEPAAFEGVLLSDVLAANGLSGMASILVTAENDYSTTFSEGLLQDVDVLVATRVDGAPHSRRARGPIQFVIHADAYANSELTSESNFVWMAARIEPAE